MIFTISNGRIPKDKPKWTVQMYCYHYLNNCHHFSRPFGFRLFFAKKNISTSLSWFKYSNDDELKMCRLFNYLVSMNDLTLLILNGMTRVRYTKMRNDISNFLCCFVPISIQDELSPWWEFLDAAKWCQSFGRR